MPPELAQEVPINHHQWHWQAEIVIRKRMSITAAALSRLVYGGTDGGDGDFTLHIAAGHNDLAIKT